ncbi:MAG TPA: trigger factor [Actinomycetota bacterium]
MQTEVTRESATTIRLTVAATAEDVAPSIDRAVHSLADQVKVPGFRKGKVPRRILESRLGAAAVRDAILQEAVPSLLARVLQEHEDINPVAPPTLERSDFEGDALSFEALVEVRPPIELPNMELISVERPSPAATGEEVDEQLERLRDRFATLEPVGHPATAGDFVLIDISSTIDGESFEPLSGKDQSYEVGSGMFVPEMDENLTGVSAGDIVEFAATLPEGAGEHGGKVVAFRVLVKEVREKKVPALDDEFATMASEFETLAELRADVAERIERIKTVQADSVVRDRVLEQVLEETEFEPPETLVVSEMAYRLERFEQQLKQSGITLERYMEANGFTEEQVEQDLRTQAERNVRAQLILEDVGKQEGLQVTQEEIAQEVAYHAEMTRSDPKEVAESLRDPARLRALAGDIIRRKALNLLVEQAEITQEGSEAPPVEQASGDDQAPPEA